MKNQSRKYYTNKIGNENMIFHVINHIEGGIIRYFPYVLASFYLYEAIDQCM